MVTILVIPLSAAHYNLEADWAEASAEVILRRCPICLQDSIIGHGRRRKQAHDEHHDWIGIRRGVWHLCGKTFTFLIAWPTLLVAAGAQEEIYSWCLPLQKDVGCTNLYVRLFAILGLGG